jgi:hypothetical protein
MQEFNKFPLNSDQGRESSIYNRALEAPSNQVDTNDIEALRGDIRDKYPTSLADDANNPPYVSGDVVITGSDAAAGIIQPFGQIAPTHAEIALATRRALDNPVDYAVKRAA